jgi:hypothetical protein
MLEKLGRDGHSSFLRKFVNYGLKKFCNIVTWTLFLDEDSSSWSEASPRINSIPE